MSGWWDDDEELLALLRDALAEQRDVPARFVEAGKASYAWHSIDAELAALAYDSVADPSPFAGANASSRTIARWNGSTVGRPATSNSPRSASTSAEGNP